MPHLQKTIVSTHSKVLEYQIGKLSASAHFSAEHSTVNATSKSHQLSLLFPDIEPSIIDTVLETVGGSITQQLNGCQVMPILIPTRLIHHRMMCRERKI